VTEQFGFFEVGGCSVEPRYPPHGSPLSFTHGPKLRLVDVSPACERRKSAGTSGQAGRWRGRPEHR
jgi:hypothetical protein